MQHKFKLVTFISAIILTNTSYSQDYIQPVSQDILSKIHSDVKNGVKPNCSYGDAVVLKNHNNKLIPIILWGRSESDININHKFFKTSISTPLTYNIDGFKVQKYYNLYDKQQRLFNLHIKQTSWGQKCNQSIFSGQECKQYSAELNLYKSKESEKDILLEQYPVTIIDNCYNNKDYKFFKRESLIDKIKYPFH